MTATFTLGCHGPEGVTCRVTPSAVTVYENSSYAISRVDIREVVGWSWSWWILDFQYIKLSWFGPVLQGIVTLL